MPAARIREITPFVKNTHAINLVLVVLTKFASKCTKANVMSSQRASIKVMAQVAVTTPAPQDCLALAVLEKRVRFAPNRVV
jgi:hypothetical protein